MTESEQLPRTPRFEPGAKVRVKYGVMSPDFEDIPLGGWTGTIKESASSENETAIEIEWDRRTLDAMPPVYRKRCERDDLEFEIMWLTDDEVEPDDGTPVPVEQPTKIKTPPLSEKDQDDRVRKALGLTHDDPLPAISFETLLTYHRYLKVRLKFPFTVFFGDEEVGTFSRRRATTTVTGLIEPEWESLDVEEGLFCRCRVQGDETEVPLDVIEVGKRGSNSKLIADYAYWFHNWPCDDEGDIDRDDDVQAIGSALTRPRLWLCIQAAFVWGVRGGIVGTTIGAALGASNGARLAALIGGITLGLNGAILLGGFGFLQGPALRVRHAALLGVGLGSLGGGLVGVLAGLAVVTLPWSLLGLVAAILLGRYVFPQKPRRWMAFFRAIVLGTCGGILISAFRQDQARATAGAVSGAIIGSVIPAGLILLLVGAVCLTVYLWGAPRGHHEEDGKVEIQS